VSKFKCDQCEDTGWICENCWTRWEKEDGTTCCGAGQNCVCNPNGEVNFIEIFSEIKKENMGKEYIQ
jgi:protein involved in temperature-dependent protein secretion